MIARGEPGFTLGVADRGVAGYSPLRDPLVFGTWREAQREAEARNIAMGLTIDEAMEIVDVLDGRAEPGVLMDFQFLVNVSVERMTGKFVSRSDIEEALVDALEQADPSTVDVDESEYEVSDFEHQRGAPAAPGAATQAPG